LLTDTDIEQLLDLIGPLNPSSITPAGYDVTVGSLAFSWSHRRFIDVDRAGHVVIRPGDLMLVWTKEELRLPKDVGGSTHPLVWHMAQGIVGSSGTLDPGYEGRVIMQLANVGKHPLKLTSGETCGTLLLHHTESQSAFDHRKERDRDDIRRYLESIASRWSWRDLLRTPKARQVALLLAMLVGIGVLIGLPLLTSLALRDAATLISVLGVLGLVVLEMTKARSA